MSRRRLPTARKCLPYRVRCKFWNLVAVAVSLFLLSLGIFVLFPHTFQYPGRSQASQRPKAVLPLQAPNISAIDNGSKIHCRFHVCFDINRCMLSLREDVLGVYVRGPYDFYDPSSSISLSLNVSREYTELLETVRKSRYYVSNPTSACVFIPPIDTLVQQNLDLDITSTILNTLPGWEDGQNWLIFSMLPGEPPHFSTTPDFYYGKAMVAGAGFSPASYRSGFDVSIPVFNPLTRSEKLYKMAATSKRPRLLTMITHGTFVNLEEVRKVARESGGMVELAVSPCPYVKSNQQPTRRCGHKDKETHPFPDLLLHSRFCLLTTGGSRIAMPDFIDMLMTGCVPVVVSDILLPYSEVLDWNAATIKCLGCSLTEVLSRLGRVPAAMLVAWRQQVLYLYNRYFSSMATITMATLDILNDRVFPMSGKSADFWNKGYDVSRVAQELGSIRTKREEGFTAVILTYNRVQSLFQVIKSVARAPSCVKVVVIWNNVQASPPPVKEWPRIRQKIEIIRSKENKLSNRFYPYTNLTTAVFSLDDDITMLTVDELEFAYKAWQEYPNRLVGFPSRVHIRSSDSAGTHWKYESDWLNNVSMVLTGAAFYHKYYHYLYTYVMPGEIREWVDSHMNCEDIAMNYLVSKYTGQPPLKVSARKKFVCPSCPAEDSLWNDLDHYKERTECVNLFTKLFGQMPLKAVKFRVDPVLYKTKGIDRETMAYPDMGEL